MAGLCIQYLVVLRGVVFGSHDILNAKESSFGTGERESIQGLVHMYRASADPGARRRGEFTVVDLDHLLLNLGLRPRDTKVGLGERKIIGSERFRVTCLIRARPVVWMDILESSSQAVVNAVSELEPAGTRTCLIATLGGDLLAWHPSIHCPTSRARDS